jgi:hypothetical protein
MSRAFDSHGNTEPTTTLVFPSFDCFSFVISFVNAIHGSPPLLDPDKFLALISLLISTDASMQCVPQVL